MNEENRPIRPNNQRYREVAAMSSIIHVTTANYPESDGKPMGEADLHRNEMVRQIQLLERFFAGQRVYVSGDLLVFYEQGKPKKFVVPDVFVAKGLEPTARRIYKVWFEGKPPDVILEVTSQKTKKKTPSPSRRCIINCACPSISSSIPRRITWSLRCKVIGWSARSTSCSSPTLRGAGERATWVAAASRGVAIDVLPAGHGRTAAHGRGIASGR